jgi:hypothetical protein
MSQYEIDSDGEDYPSSPIKVEKGIQRSDVFPCQSFSPDKLEEEIYNEVGDVVALLGLEVTLLQSFITYLLGIDCHYSLL